MVHTMQKIRKTSFQRIAEARRRKKTATIRTKTGRNVQKSQTKQLKSKLRAKKKRKLS